MDFLSRFSSLFSTETGDEKRVEDGDYQYMFCPHCGEWIGHRYSPMTRTDRRELGVDADMRVGCTNCKRVSAVSVIACKGE